MLNKRKVILFLIVFFTVKLVSQNKQVIYDFAELPQTLLLNPGAETNYKFHIGMPLLSSVSGEFGTTGFTLKDLFAADNRSINDKISSILRQVNFRDHIKINSQIEILSGGYRYNSKTYFSFGIYQEIDGITYFPKDLSTLLTEGNAANNIDKSFSLSHLLYKLDVFGVMHFGISKKMNKKLTLGGRFKIYSSTVNLESTNNTGTFTTVESANNIYKHYLNNADVNLRTSGLIANNKFIENPNTYIKNTLLGANLGIGFDFGFNYKSTPQLEFTGSILDIGFIYHKKNIKNSFVKGSYVFEELDEDFKEKVHSGDNQDAYISWRPTKINASFKYSFGEKRSEICYDDTYKDFYTDAFGAQLFSVFRPLGPQLAFTGFYQKSFTKKLHAKITYTIDEYSFYNFGAGVSTQIGKIIFYGMIDNITEFSDIAAANNISFQLGINLIF